ncbi:DUF4396 domain-containing protein [Streptomyces sp. NY05-11A]|uniref:DUF4396 domain-containing protein n=1 Tax=Streptomyces soliscabiei TaxID=588897 RepID=UPI0029B8CBD3|nr:DUF4396 domain-containing protein [Streptomyces sp. NY05-11A]MDX2681675.1 DUF4396 domain-containing protein [Streptomyces sp. NY05-11A]
MARAHGRPHHREQVAACRFLPDVAFAWLLGIGFQYFTIAPMRGLGPAQALWAAVRADTLSIVSLQVGLFAGMWAYQEFLHGLAKTTGAYWLLMQLAMIVASSLPGRSTAG